MGPRFFGRTYLFLKKITDREIFLITSFHESSHSPIATNEILDTDEFEGGFLVCDNKLDSNQKTEPIFTRGRHKRLDGCNSAH